MDAAVIEAFLQEGLGYGPAPESDAPARKWLAQHRARFGHFIGGTFASNDTAATFTVVNPANTNEVLATVEAADDAAVNAAMEAADAAFPAWSALSCFERARYLYAIARAIAKHSRVFAVLESLNNGKTFRESNTVDVPLAVRHFYAHAGWAMTRNEDFPRMKPGGVIGAVIPWNFPFLMLAWKIAPAIAAGNTIVLKPAEFTPLTAMLFAEICNEAGLPPGVVNIVNGGPATGERIVAHPTPWKIAFTGSTDVGKRIRAATAGSGKHLTLELGGKSPFIVFPDADLDAAVEGIVDAIWFNYGQVCCAGSRLLVHEAIEPEFIRRLKVRMAKLRGGAPLDKAMDVGAINSEAQREKIERLVAQGLAEGNEIWQPEGWTCPSGCLAFPPTLITEVEPSHTLAQEEVFGPVLVVMTFRTPQEAVELANNTVYGLAASVWSQSIDTALDVARQLEAGTVWVNATNVFDAAAGFGGVRESGYGREGGREGMYDVLVEHLPEPADVPHTDTEDTKDDSHPPMVDQTHRFLVGGALARPDGGASFTVRAPNDTALGVVGDANRKDVRNAVEAARKAAKDWGNRAAHTRAQILYFLGEKIAAAHEALARVIRAERRCSGDNADREVVTAIELLFYWAGRCDKFEGTTQSVPHRMLVVGLKEPVGVIGIRAPDEYPLLAFVGSFAPAIAMGNSTVIVAGQRCLTAMHLVPILQHCDLPVGVVNVLTSKDPDAIATLLADHMDVDAVWSFGSRSGEAAIERSSAGNMKRTWTHGGRRINWADPATRTSLAFLREATRLKNVWVPYGA